MRSQAISETLSILLALSMSANNAGSQVGRTPTLHTGEPWGAAEAIRGTQGSPEAKPRPWPEPYLNYAYLRRAWEVTGRAWVEKFSGTKWSDTGKTWELDRQWPNETQVGPQSYYIERATRGAANMGYACHDIQLLNEVSQFYLVYANRFTTLGDMRRMASSSTTTTLLNDQGDDPARTLLWIEKQPAGSRVRECALCNSQFFHPAARLIRIITLLPESEPTPTMRKFVSLYAPLIVRDHLIRLLYQAKWDYYGLKDLPEHLVDIWKAISAFSVRPKLSYQFAMTDRDLWLIATAAEILGANAHDRGLVPLNPEEKTRLQNAVQTGVSLFQRKGTFYPDTRNFRGEVVGSMSYFNGDYDDHPENAYTGCRGSSFPTPQDKGVHPGTSWDISHFYRVPVFMRSLYDNKTAAGVDFPSTRDVELLTNQLMYRVFKGDFNHPLFDNFFDGCNGWYRVGYGRPTFGYPPAEYCDSRSPDRPCLVTGMVLGWGALASFNPDLTELLHALVKLAMRDDPETKQFKERYYWDNGQSFSFRDARGQPQYPSLLFFILSTVPEKLQACASP
jgi:hypothetical protein